MKSRLDRDIDQIIAENGIHDVIAALARYCHRTERKVLYHRFVRIYEWLTAGSKGVFK